MNISTGIVLKLLRIKVSVIGAEKLPKDTRFLLVGNHCSNFDPIITWYMFKEYQLAFVSKQENFRIPIFGRIIRKCCFLAIDRENPRNAAKTIVKATSLIQSDEVSLGIYPEGTRSKSGELLPFHNGVFKIAQKAKVPIVVLSVNGTEKIAKNLPWHSTRIELKVLETIQTKEVITMRTAEIGEHVRNLLKKELR